MWFVIDALSKTMDWPPYAAPILPLVQLFREPVRNTLEPADSRWQDRSVKSQIRATHRILGDRRKKGKVFSSENFVMGPRVHVIVSDLYSDYISPEPVFVTFNEDDTLPVFHHLIFVAACKLRDIQHLCTVMLQHYKKFAVLYQRPNKKSFKTITCFLTTLKHPKLI